jgi:tRNA (guanine-N7-)-methyltransferase
LVAVWSLAADGDMLDLSEVFRRPSPRVVLDIGFGGGEGLVAMAAARPEECLVGVEVHTPGVAGVLDAVAVGGWDHVRVVQADVLDFMPRLAPGSLHGVRLWFPDPWLKNKQRHRRIVRPEVVARWAELLAVGGCLHIATDITDYARHVERVLVGEPRFAGGMVDRPEWRPVTRFEIRGRNEGRAATDLMYERLA